MSRDPIDTFVEIETQRSVEVVTDANVQQLGNVLASSASNSAAPTDGNAELAQVAQNEIAHAEGIVDLHSGTPKE